MSAWACGIAGCGERFEEIEALIHHQADRHGHCECKVCGESFPEGYPAIRHAFSDHTRAEYVRAYDADSDDIRVREQIKDVVEDHIDPSSLLSQLDGDPVRSVGD